MAILPIGTVTTPFVPSMPAIAPVAVPEAGAAGGTSFGEMLGKGIENVTATQDKASTLSAQLATGQLTNIHDFTTAAAKASLGVSLTSSVRNRVAEAYQEIMRMTV